MSVINQMLADLEARRATPRDRTGLYTHLRPLPSGPRAPSGLLAGALLGAAVAVGIVLGVMGYRWMGQPAEQPPTVLEPGRASAPPAVREPVVAAGRSGPASGATSAAGGAGGGEAAQETDGGAPGALASAPSHVDAAGTVAPSPEAGSRAAVPGATLTPERSLEPGSAIATEATSARLAPAAKASTPDPGKRDRAATARAKTDPPVGRDAGNRDTRTAKADAAPVAAAGGGRTVAAVSAARSVPPLTAPAGGLEVRVSPAQRTDNDYRRAVNALNRGDEAEARAVFAGVLAADPRHDAARQAMIGLEVHAGRMEAAEALADQRLALASDHAGFAMVSARVKFDRGEKEQALATLDRSAAHAQGRADYHGFRAAILQQLDRHADAVAAYRSALGIAPGSGAYAIGLGMSLEALDRVAEARVAFGAARDNPGLSAQLRAFAEQRLRQIGG